MGLGVSGHHDELPSDQSPLWRQLELEFLPWPDELQAGDFTS